jgi:hypothetical protein
LWRQNRDKDIKQHSQYACGRIIRRTGSLKNGNHWHYEFFINGRMFEGYRSTHVDYNVSVGDYFLVNFSKVNPQHSKIMYEYKLKNYDSAIVRQVWNKVPDSLFISARK